MTTSARLILGLAMSLIAPATNPGSPPSSVVIAELFTSEGCSSCPPADTLVRELADEQPFAGAHLIALEEHVDYWDRLGWRDPFSSAQFTSRQTEYSRVFRSNGIYTPQLVVDGVRECVGSDRSAIRAIVTDSIRRPRAAVRVQSVAVGSHLRVTVGIDVPADVERRGIADVFVIVAERGLVSAVPRGENGGRTLVHGAVARSLAPMGDLSDRDRTFAAIVDVPIARNWNSRNLQIVGVIQERDSRRILGAGRGNFIQRREQSMKNVTCFGFVAVVLAVSAVAGAQGHKMDDKMDKMKSETTYTGCIERSSDGAVTLGHAMASSAATKKPMAKDSMAKDSMAKDSTTHDSMMKDSMASTLGLVSTSVDLAKHVGHKVTVKGVAGDTMGGMAMFNVKSIKMVGSSCS